MKFSLLLMIAATSGAGAAAFANDTTAKLSAGGLVLTRNDHISMLSEDLYVSRSAIRVRYRFLNTSDRDVTVRIAFPMPDIGGAGFFENDVSIPVDDPANILGFSTRIDGREVRAEIEQKALVKGVDRTDWLNAQEIPLALHQEGARAAIRRLSKIRQDEAVQMGVLDDDMNPAWVLKTTYHWLQTFPAGRPTIIEHSYRPSVGSTAGTMLGSKYGADTARRYCVDPALTATLKRSALHNEGTPRFSEKWVDYILVTGGNWKEPIGRFRLVVDKESPETLVSFCGSGVRKIGPTRFELRRTKWRPERDLSILFLTPF